VLDDRRARLEAGQGGASHGWAGTSRRGWARRARGRLRPVIFVQVPQVFPAGVDVQAHGNRRGAVGRRPGDRVAGSRPLLDAGEVLDADPRQARQFPTAGAPVRAVVPRPEAPNASACGGGRSTQRAEKNPPAVVPSCLPTVRRPAGTGRTLRMALSRPLSSRPGSHGFRCQTVGLMSQTRHDRASAGSQSLSAASERAASARWSPHGRRTWPVEHGGFGTWTSSDLAGFDIPLALPADSPKYAGDAYPPPGEHARTSTERFAAARRVHLRHPRVQPQLPGFTEGPWIDLALQRKWVAKPSRLRQLRRRGWRPACGSCTWRTSSPKLHAVTIREGPFAFAKLLSSTGPRPGHPERPEPPPGYDKVPCSTSSPGGATALRKARAEVPYPGARDAAPAAGRLSPVTVRDF